MADNSKIFFRPFKEKNVLVTKYIVPEGYEALAHKTFMDCSYLEEVKLPSSLREIDSNAFRDCYSLKEITLPKKVKVIGNMAFKGCSNLTRIALPSLKKISERCFDGCFGLKEVYIPKSVKAIEDFAFMECKTLEEIKLPKGLKTLGEYTFHSSGIKKIELPKSMKVIPELCFSLCSNLKEVKLPNSIKEIKHSAFYQCNKLQKINLPDKLTEIAHSTFKECSALEEIGLPKKIKSIGLDAFSACTSLKSIELPKKLEYIEASAFSSCESLTEVVVPESVKSIGVYAFYKCKELKRVTLPTNIDIIDSGTFSECSSLEKVNLENVKFIKSKAFSGCTSLNEFVVPKGLIEMESEALTGCGFKYVYKLSGQENLVFAKELPTGDNVHFDRLVDLDKVNSCILDFDISELAFEENIDKIMPVVEKLSHSKMVISNDFYSKYNERGMLGKIANEMNFKFFPKEIPELRAVLALQGRYNEESLAFLKFANAIGCFSNEKLLNKEGKETPTPFAQKASTALAGLLRSERLNGLFKQFFANLPIDVKPNQDFLSFALYRDSNKEYPNLEKILEIDRLNSGFAAKVVSKFDSVKKLRKGLDENGKPYTLTWDETLQKFSTLTSFENVTGENEDIAQLFIESGLDQDDFDEAAKLRSEAVHYKVRPHILKTPLREETICERVEKIKNSTEGELENSKELIGKLYGQKFTYEMLNKYDPKNAIIGIYTSCCATLTSAFYGRRIVAATMISDDVQNLVVRDASGDIVAKGTLYVNRDYGYGVFNDFEINESYKKHESTSKGFYNVDGNNKEEIDRELIFKAFQRGIKAFVAQYDKENPNRPLKAITVGMGYNRLKRQCIRYKEATTNYKVPLEYSFADAEESQRVLYQRGKTEQQLIVNKDEDMDYGQ